MLTIPGGDGVARPSLSVLHQLCADNWAILVTVRQDRKEMLRNIVLALLKTCDKLIGLLNLRFTTPL